MILEMFRARDVSPEQVEKLAAAVAAMPGSYRRLVQPSLAFQAEILGVDAKGLAAAPARTPSYREELVVFGEVLVASGALLGVIARQEVRRWRELSDGRIEAVPGGEELSTIIVFSLGNVLGSEPLTDLVSRLGEAVGLEFEPHRYGSRRFRELVEEERMAAAGPPTDDELNASRLLADKTARTLAVAIKSSGGLLVSDAARPLPAEARSDAEAAIAKLQEAGLVKTELVVICNKTDAQVARATTKKQLDQSARAGITCACGQPLTAERVEEALTIADLARDLLDGNRWMSVLLFDELVRVGVNAERIFLEQQAGGDEVDCVADISGEFVLFELKDKEFNLGNAYSFGAKIGILRPEHPVVITTEYVGGDAKEHFERAAASGTRPSTLERSHQRPVLYIEGLENLRSGVEQLAYQIYRADGATLLDDVLSVASIQSGSILAALGDDEKQSAASSRRTTRDRARKARAT